MFRHAFVLTALLLSSLLPASGAVPPEALGSVRYEVRYKLTGKGSKVADATISLENGTRDGKPVLHSRDWTEDAADENHRIRREPVTGGYVSWVEDLTAISRLNREIGYV